MGSPSLDQAAGLFQDSSSQGGPSAPDRFTSSIGGLTSYGTDLPDLFRRYGAYIGRILGAGLTVLASRARGEPQIRRSHRDQDPETIRLPTPPGPNRTLARLLPQCGIE
jgi:hypothetical protein